MKNFLIASLFLWSTLSQAAAPYGLKGQSQTQTIYPNVHQAPYNQVTNLGGINALIETGNPNILLDPGAEGVTTSWSAYKDAAGVAPVDGTGGTPTVVSVSNSTSSPLSGNKSLVLVKTASNGQGEGISIPFTIPNSSKYKVNRLSFDYGIVSGTYTDDQLEWFVYDVTNATVKPFTPSKLKNHTLTSEAFAPNGEFQASDSSSYRLIAHIAGTSASAYTLKFDNFKLGIYEKTYGSPVTDWIPYTPTFTGFGTVTGIDAYYKRVGDSVMIKAKYLTGVHTGVEARISLPAGMTTTAFASIRTAGIVGNAVVQNVDGLFVLSEPSVSYLTYGYVVSNSQVSLSKRLGNDLTTGTFSVETGLIPIAGLSSSQLQSTDADTRVVNFIGSVTTNQAVTAFVTNLPVVTAKDSHGAWTGSTYVVKVPGDYRLGGALYATTTASNAYVAVNGATSYYLGRVLVNIPSSLNAVIPNLKAGDVVSIRFDVSTTIAGDTSTSINIAKESGPSQISNSESVSALYTGGPPTGTLNTSLNLVTFGTKVKDSHNAYSAGSYTVPVNGVYDISAQIWVSATYALNQASGVHIFIDGVVKYNTYVYAGGSVLNIVPLVSVNSVPLLAGQVVSIRSYTNGTSPSFAADATGNFFSIVKTGNY
jgi:hypothetical protein